MKTQMRVAAAARPKSSLGRPRSEPRRRKVALLPRIVGVAKRLMKDVPAREWDRLPTDLSENLDHYLYGAPKR